MGGKTYDNTPETPPVVPAPAAPESDEIDVKLDAYVALVLETVKLQYANVRNHLTDEALNMIAEKLDSISELLGGKIHRGGR